MSLQVWLPLNGDLHNQGLSNVTVTNNGATIDNNGKIGKCYSFGNNTYLSASNISIDKNSWSMAAWIYVRSTPTNNAYMVGIGMESGAYFTGCLDLYSTNFVVRIGSANYNSNIACSLNTWTHFAATSTNNTLKMYINGTLVKTTSITPYSNYSNLYIGARNGGVGTFDGKINDVRIYNHVLSDKEIEELAKGLVLWYQLDGRTDSQLPLGYQQLEYIQTTGTQKILLPQLDFSQDFILNMDWEYTSYSTSGWEPLIVQTERNKVWFGGNTTGTFGLRGYSGSKYIDTTAPSINTKLQILLTRNNNAYNLSINNNFIGSSSVNLASTAAIYLFNDGSNSYSTGKCYHFRFNNQIDLYPAKRLSDNVLGMYDIISKTFFTNAGTGTFIAGPQIPRDNIPGEYQRVDYIEATGTQYINTGLSLPRGYKAKFKVMLNAVGVTQAVLGCYINNSADFQRNYFVFTNSNKSLIGYGSNSTSYSYPTSNITANTPYVIEASNIFGNRYCIINDVNYTLTEDNTEIYANYPFGIFAQNISGSFSQQLNGKLYYITLYDYTNTCVLNGIPVKRISDNVVGIYDTVQKRFLTNAGTGSFNCGPEIRGIIYDSSGYNNNGIIYGNLQMVKGSPKYNYSTQFSGNTNYIEAASLPATTSTICAWVKFNTIPNSGYSMILHDKVSQLAIGHSFTSNHLITYIGSESIGSWITFQPTENTWYHIAVVKTGATTRNIYINGEQVTATDTSYWSGDLDTFMVGGRHTNGQYQDFFNGKMSDVRVYVTALTTTQIQELYNTSMSVDSNGNSIPRGL